VKVKLFSSMDQLIREVGTRNANTFKDACMTRCLAIFTSENFWTANVLAEVKCTIIKHKRSMMVTGSTTDARVRALS